MRYHSDDESTLAEKSPVSVKKEAALVIKGLRDVRNLPQWKKASIIAVVRDQCVPIMQVKCKAYEKNRWSLRRKPPILVMSDSQLRTSADELAEYRGHTRLWVVVVSGLIPEISFNISADIDRLHIARVNRLDPKGMLVVSGRSTWHRTRLDEFENGSNNRWLTNNKRVSISADNFGSGPWSTMSSDSFGEGKRRRASSHLEELSNQQLGNKWWESVKGPITGLTALAGLAVGSFKAWTTLTCKAKGIFISIKCGPVAFQAGGFSLKLLAGLKVAAPPVAVGLGVASLIYFVPWDKFFTWLNGWLRRIFSGLWDKICSLWDRFWSAFLRWNSEQGKGGCNCHQAGAFA